MTIDFASLLYMLGIALAAASVTYVVLFRAGSYRIALACSILMFALRFGAAGFLDVEPFGELSTFRDSGAPIPLWLLAGCYFNQFGVWGAVLAFAVLRRRHLTRCSSGLVGRS